MPAWPAPHTQSAGARPGPRAHSEASAELAAGSAARTPAAETLTHRGARTDRPPHSLCAPRRGRRRANGRLPAGTAAWTRPRGWARAEGSGQEAAGLRPGAQDAPAPAPGSPRRPDPAMSRRRRERFSPGPAPAPSRTERPHSRATRAGGLAPRVPLRPSRGRRPSAAPRPAPDLARGAGGGERGPRSLRALRSASQAAARAAGTATPPPPRRVGAGAARAGARPPGVARLARDCPLPTPAPS